MATVSPLINHQKSAIATAEFSREDLIAVVNALRSDLEHNPEAWENSDLSSFLEALARWVEDMDGYYQNMGQPVPSNPWHLIDRKSVV